MKRKSLAIVVVVGLLLLVLAGWWWQHRRDREPANELVLYGNIELRQVSLAFEGNGRVLALHSEEGAQVKAGAVLAVLDTHTLALQAQQAQAQVEVQRQNLLRLRAGARPQEVAQSRTRLGETRADAARAQRELARLQEVSATTQGRGVSPQDLDRARTAAQIALARVQEQQDALRIVELGARPEEVAAGAAQLKASEALLEQLQYQITLGELRAPTDGTIRSRLLEVGDLASPQRPVFAIALTQPKWARLYVGETSLGKVKPGMPARIFIDSQPDRPLTGHVGYISSVAEFTPKSVQTEDLRTSLVYEVRVVADDPANVLRLGEPVTVRIALR